MGEMKNSFDTLVREYPSGANVQSLLAAKMFKCSPDQIAVGNGAAELIDILAQYKNEKLGLFIPTFEEYSSRFKSVTLQKLNNQNFTYDKNDIIKLAQENDGVILINPDNPSGNFIPYKDLLELINWFKANKKTFIVDEKLCRFCREWTRLDTNERRNP
ncbi:aminotransferase class I/II-fold pyridoxal phosphate-dependent enzyme [Providencia hangzhouensis]|uniref:aminotransferase class I/II-fold pyridoxal phosphate-dependent enzyme n=1 Tax=Providencia hangzhouensis TaxID=3031799 RepID=UPI0034DD4CBF